MEMLQFIFDNLGKTILLILVIGIAISWAREGRER